MYFGSAIHLNKTGIIVLCALAFILLLYTISNGQQAKSNDKINLKQLLEAAIKASENGGVQVVAVKDHLNIKIKGLTKEGDDDSVTTADFLSHCLIIETLRHNFPKLQIISEETVANCEKADKSQLEPILLENLPDEYVDLEDVTVWIDPLDATKEYTEKLYDYVTTMVCVAVKGQPVIGVVHKPFSKVTSWSWVGKKVSKDLQNLLKSNRDKMKIIISRSHKGQIESVLNKNFNNYETVIAAGAGYKVLEVAKHHVDAYVHITAIKKWDICAGNAIIKAVGGDMTTKNGKIINYSNSNNVLNENGLVVTSDNYYHDLFVGNL